MINNRQGGRRRGRGGRGDQNLGGQPGNRQDNRQRGNAAQLLEKYKSMARDSQLAGDRVQTEYYLQFADHYFRVLSESRARFEDQNPRASATTTMDDDEGDEEMVEAGEAEVSNDERQERPDRNERQDRADRSNRRDRDARAASTATSARRDATEQSRRSCATVNGRDDSHPVRRASAGDRRDEPASRGGRRRAAPRPRRRLAQPAPADGDDEIAPAA